MYKVKTISFYKERKDGKGIFYYPEKEFLCTDFKRNGAFMYFYFDRKYWKIPQRAVESIDTVTQVRRNHFYSNAG